MPHVFIPPDIRPLVAGHNVLEADGNTVAQVIDDVNDRYPGFKQRLVDGNQLRPGLVVAVGTAVTSLGLLQRVSPGDEIHFLPSIGGGC